MIVPQPAINYRIQNYRDPKELVEMAAIAGHELSEAAVMAIEEGRLRYVTVAEVEVYLYFTKFALRADPLPALSRRHKRRRPHKKLTGEAAAREKARMRVITDQRKAARRDAAARGL